MSAVVQEARYIYSDVSQNNNKFWNITLLGDNTCVTQWGRVGENGANKEFTFSDPHSARRFFERKRAEKEGKGYTAQRTLGNSAAAQSARLTQVALEQIGADCPETRRLIAKLSRANIHSILAQTSLRYDAETGAFSTPLGIVTKDAIAEARELLTEIAELVRRERWDDAPFAGKLSAYLRLIPRNIGRAKPQPRALYPDLDAVQAQNALLDNLEASVDAALAKAETEDPITDRLFDVRLRTVDEADVIDRLRRKYRTTLHGCHASSRLDVARVYEVEIASMRRDFEERGRRVGGVMELWHGTRVGNLLSILKSGFVIPHASAPHVTGRMFGNGVYFSDQSTKSLNYACGYWAGTREDVCYMFLCDVAMGRAYTPRSWTEGFPVQGYDSVFAKAGLSGVINNEMVVFDIAQINPRYLVEFSQTSCVMRHASWVRSRP
jgi:poly [ADP-ribose] polymerase